MKLGVVLSRYVLQLTSTQTGWIHIRPPRIARYPSCIQAVLMNTELVRTLTELVRNAARIGQTNCGVGAGEMVLKVIFL